MFFPLQEQNKLKRGRKSTMISNKLNLLLLFWCSIAAPAFGKNNGLKNLPIISFEEGYSHLFGDENLMVLKDGKSVHLSLDQTTGSGFVSHDMYLHGFFSASIKLPPNYTAGVVVAYYMSNSDIYRKNHDEVDFEFLGNIRGQDWNFQTNVYGNGSTSVGREERYTLWFDPTEDFHQYSILWTEDQIIFYVDEVPIRDVKRTKAMGGDFPSKPMSLYATIWDGSNWATNGGKFGVNYTYAPYVAQFSDLVLHGCTAEPIKCEPETDGWVPTGISHSQRHKMVNFRKRHLIYSYCYDGTRYRAPPLECVLDPAEAERLRRFDPVTFARGHGRRHGSRVGKVAPSP